MLYYTFEDGTLSWLVDHQPTLSHEMVTCQQ